MKRYMLLIFCSIFVLFVGCTYEKENERQATSMKINGKTFPYDQKLIDAIDKTKWINTSEPPTVKTMLPGREPQFIIEVLNHKNEKYTLWDTGRNYLISINNGEKNYWLALENEEYVKAKKQTTNYKKVEIIYPLSIDLVTSKLEQKYTISSIQKVEEAFQIPGNEQERHCYLEGKECINFYLGDTLGDALRIKEKLKEKLALLNMIIEPKIYTVRNIVIMYTPYEANNYVLEKDIVRVIKSFN